MLRLMRHSIFDSLSAAVISRCSTVGAYFYSSRKSSIDTSISFLLNGYDLLRVGCWASLQQQRTQASLWILLTGLACSGECFVL
jgi:hypothetical protein